MEIWKDIKGYEGYYQISNLGNVKSLDRKDNLGRKVKGKDLAKIKRKDGYLCVKLNKNSNCIEHLIHKLVAKAFILNPNNLKEINHKDENKGNNKTDNLEWCTRSYNINYGVANEKRRKSLLNKRGKKIVQKSENNEIISIFKSLREANRITHTNIAHICECCQGKRKKANNYKWEYLEI